MSTCLESNLWQSDSFSSEKHFSKINSLFIELEDIFYVPILELLGALVGQRLRSLHLDYIHVLLLNSPSCTPLGR